jgi:type IV secretory pathway TraG/TraD family ATPase VirD4
MNVELGKLADGGLVIMCDSPFPHEIRRIEYYRDQKLMMLVYNNPSHEGDLMHYELADVASQSVESSPSVLVVDHSPDRKMYGYDVPLVQVGI